MTSYFQDGGHDVCPPLAAAASACCPLVHRVRMTSSLARCMCSVCDPQYFVLVVMMNIIKLRKLMVYFLLTTDHPLHMWRESAL